MLVNLMMWEFISRSSKKYEIWFVRYRAMTIRTWNFRLGCACKAIRHIGKQNHYK